MNIQKLARFLCGELPNSKAIPIAEFVVKLENDRSITDDMSKRKYLTGAYFTEYKQLFVFLYSSDNGTNKIRLILEKLGLPLDFIDQIDLSNYVCNNCHSVIGDNESLGLVKNGLLEEFNVALSELKTSKNNKNNGNVFEGLCEKFLLCSSYFEPGFKEFEFEDGTEKIDRLMKMKKDIGNFGKNTGYLGYVILEAKYKKDKENAASEVAQLESYIKRLLKYGISKYAIVITSNKFKKTYQTKIGDLCREKVMDDNPFYLSLITIEEIINFLENTGAYKYMSFDEFIERSFIRWLK